MTAALLALLAAALWDRPFTLDRPGEVIAAVTARCGGCSWGSPDRTGAMLVLEVDGRYSQHLPLTREGPAAYRVSLGGLRPGTRSLRIRLDRAATPPAVRDVAVGDVRIEVVAADQPGYRALLFAPRLHPRLNAVGRFTDVPLLLWYERDATPRGTRIRYSVVFSNEDGGTPPDRLMATWGRLTDIEHVLAVELDHEGKVLEATYQGPKHRILPHRRMREGRHPELWVVTDNNMLRDRGKSRPVYAPAPFPFDLTGVSREAVMDAHPWTYQVSSQEAIREGRVDERARPGSKMLPDPRRFAYLEACAETRDAAITFGIGLDGPDGREWHDSDGGQKEFRILRRSTEYPNGCFRGAVALPEGTSREAIRAVRFRAYTRTPGKDEPALPPGSGAATVLRVNRLFRLGPDFLPEPDRFLWHGALPLAVDGPPAELAVPPGPIAR